MLKIETSEWNFAKKIKISNDIDSFERLYNKICEYDQFDYNYDIFSKSKYSFFDISIMALFLYSIYIKFHYIIILEKIINFYKQEVVCKEIHTTSSTF